MVMCLHFTQAMNINLKANAKPTCKRALMVLLTATSCFLCIHIHISMYVVQAAHIYVDANLNLIFEIFHGFTIAAT